MPTKRVDRSTKKAQDVPPVQADRARAIIPAGHPLEMWTLDEAAARVRVSPDKLSRSQCPRVKWDGRTLYDPIETIAFVRLYLTHTVATSEGLGQERDTKARR